ncbi:MAG: TorF family putative porin [Rhodocyclaceae bacterium]|nr:TorF family putative porin [Rhodocyclaceae bacterium]
MRKSLLSLTVLAALPLLSAPALAEDSPISANVALVSDYQYRGISQTNENMALQGGFDYAHESGFYVGTWGSNVSWLSDGNADVSSSLEIDVYGGYSTEFAGVGVDVGLLQYLYPGNYPAGFNSADTLEGYVGVSYGPVTLKVSHSFTDLFGVDDSDGSQYYDLSASHEIAGFTLDAHFGRQKIENCDGCSYNDWKLGVSTSVMGMDVGLAYVDTDIDSSVDIADQRVILSVGKSF